MSRLQLALALVRQSSGASMRSSRGAGDHDPRDRQGMHSYHGPVVLTSRFMPETRCKSTLSSLLHELGKSRRSPQLALILLRRIHLLISPASTLCETSLTLDPALHPKALWNTSKFLNVPVALQKGGECGSVLILLTAVAGRVSCAQIRANERKNSCSGV
jgi:hypothetical protein